MTKTAKIVHALLWGFPLCGFDLRVPGEWPEDHVRVNWGLFEQTPEDDSAVRCPSCIAEAKAGKTKANG